MKKLLKRLRREVKRYHDKGVPRDKAVTEINLGEYRDWAGQERLATYAQLYKEFRGVS